MTEEPHYRTSHRLADVHQLQTTADQLRKKCSSRSPGAFGATATIIDMATLRKIAYLQNVQIGSYAWSFEAQNPGCYVFAETLRDGTAVTVRAARTNDGPKIRRAFQNLERDTVYTRFFGYKAAVSNVELARITAADFETRVALLVTIGAGEG